MATAAPRGRWTPFALALLCAHCALTVLVAGLALAVGGSSAVILGVNIHYVWPPVLIIGVFAWWVWSGARAARAADGEHCAVPVPTGER